MSIVSIVEHAFQFDCEGDSLVAVATQPEQPESPVGVLVIVGGPQYRAGSHRQFVLLARTLAEAGIPCMRFDYRGMGDSEGEPREFTNITADIQTAIDAFMDRMPGIKRVVLWGLCDAASAAACYGPEDVRVAGLVLLNPWVRTDQSGAKVYLKHYYWERLSSLSFWRKLASGGFEVGRAVSDARDLLRRALKSDEPAPGTTNAPAVSLPERMAVSLAMSATPRLVILSGNDYVAREFVELIQSNNRWQAIIDKTTIKRLDDADHTFSEPVWSDQVARFTINWIRDNETD